MTQERYQEAAEWFEQQALRLRDYAGAGGRYRVGSGEIKRATEEAERHELAASVLSKLASGWVLVPAEPVREMIAAAHDGPLGADEHTITDKTKQWLIDMYKAFIAAAPKP